MKIVIIHDGCVYNVFVNDEWVLARNSIENIADEIRKIVLLTDGVIVPPVKVGDVVWFLDGLTIGEPYINSAVVSAIYSDEDGFIYFLSEKPFDFTLMDNEIFLTKEQAERALAERSTT